MPGVNSNAKSAATASTSYRNGQSKFRWSPSYEVTLPTGTQGYSSHKGSVRVLCQSDELGALLDKALAFAG